MSTRAKVSCIAMMLSVVSFVYANPAENSVPCKESSSSSQDRPRLQLRSTTTEMRKAAAARKAAAQIETHRFGPGLPPPGGQPNYFGPEPNYANSSRPQIVNRAIVANTGIRKFVDSLPGLGYSNRNNLNQYIPVAIPDQATYAGSDYYEIELGQYSQQMHSDLPLGATLRGYKQKNTFDPTINSFHYLGPLILATRNTPVRVKFFNQLPTGAAGDLFIPLDTSVMGAGMGPDGMTMYAQNRAELHLHGGNTPWISDGSPHQWITPNGEITIYPQGVSVQPVPDMPLPVPGDGTATYYYPNQQSARLMFAHDHCYGITRLNVYAGEVMPYLLTDATEDSLIDGGVLPNLGGVYRYGIPLIIQDKTFVPPAAQLSEQDPTWNYLTTVGSLWFPHVYMPNQNPADACGCNDMGRWDYGPWFWPPTNAGAGLVHGSILDPNGSGLQVPGTPNPSIVPEAFMDTPVVNGCAYPYMVVDRKPYRFRILNGCNDRFLNLQLYYADPLCVSVFYGGSGYTEAPTVTFKGDAVRQATGVATIASGLVTGIEITDYGSGYTNPPIVLFSGGGTNVTQARAIASPYTDVKMVPACPGGSFPAYYPTPDGRAGGFPDPALSGPQMIQLGTEGGFLPYPVVLPNTPIGYQYNRRDIVVLNVLEKTLFMGPAERADVIIDFSQVPSNVSYVILYNDAPAPVPAFDPRNDYYSNDSDLTDIGGAPATIAGFGPNTRTLFQFRLTSTTGTPFNLAALQAALPPAFAASQPVPIVPESTYPPPYTAPTDTYSYIQDNILTYTPFGFPSPISVEMLPKTIQELFELNYGRMNAVLGSELPFTNDGIQATVPLGYRDPPVEHLVDNEFQLWKITHNGVDTHAIHFHLFNVQVINRVGWDGSIRPPDANEIGWKETVRMNPLEDAIVALRPAIPVGLPFVYPTNNLRPLDPTMDGAATWQSFDPLTGNPVTITNVTTNFGGEYVWHCHLLGHEENDMMRPMTFNLASGRPAITGLTPGGAGVVTVNYSAPAFLGTLGPVTSYTATALPDPNTFPATAPSVTVATAVPVPIVVPGLTSGVTYNFIVTVTTTDGVSGQTVTSQASYVSASIEAP